MNAVCVTEVMNFNLANVLQSHEGFMNIISLVFSHCENTNEWLNPE